MVTSQKDQIQSLIADIEQVLGKEKPRTPWVKASEIEPQRQALVRAQAYLMSLQQSFEAPGGWGPVDPTTGQLAAPQSSPAEPTVESAPGLGSAPAVDLPPVGNAAGSVSRGLSAPTDISAAENVLQALLTEMSFLKSSALQPLRQEMDSLREERDDLSQEVKTLAQQRNQALQELNQAQLERAQLASSQAALVSQAGQVGDKTEIDEQQLNEFLQVLMSRLQENLSVQVTETLGQLESEHSAAMAKLTAATELEILELKPTGQIEEMRQIQSRSDQLLANIDSTLQRMFETLQTNIDSYQISLNEGIENMHSLGRQGEVIVRSLVDHLTQQLGQTTPPEPAFYPAPPSAFADPVGPTADTVSSLNEILPARASSATTESLRSAAVESPVSESLTADASVSESSADALAAGVSMSVPPSVDESVAVAPEAVSDEVASSDGIASEVASTNPPSEELSEAAMAVSSSDATNVEVSATTDIEAVATENFIKEDGSIDLDLLKLDIDRTEDDPSLSRDDLMIDAAVADAEVAAVEAENKENLEIESKVKPTADAAFLADLTFDDLVVDDGTLSGNIPFATPEVPISEVSVSEVPISEVPVSEVPVPDLPVPDLVVERDLSSEAVSPQLAAILPDLSTDDVNGKDIDGEASRPESATVPDLPENESPENESSEGESSEDGLALRADQIDDVISDDLVDVLDSANEEAERTAIEGVEGELDALTSDLEEEMVFDAPLPSITPLPDTAEPLESAVIPEQPASDLVDDAPQVAARANDVTSIDTKPIDTKPIDTKPIDTKPIDTRPDETLLQNQFAENRAENDTDDNDTDEDLWASPEASLSVNEAARESTTQFPPSETSQAVHQETPLAVTQFPPSDSFEASLQDLEQDLELSEVSEETLPETALPETAVPPVDFDDDLDSFPSEGDRRLGSDTVIQSPADIAATMGVAAAASGAVGKSESPSAGDSLAGDGLIKRANDTFIQPPDDEGDDDPTGGELADWFLGIDLGATGLSAVLINQRGDQVYPLCWNVAGDSESNRFRLPAVVQIEPTADSGATFDQSEQSQFNSGAQLGVVGPAALQQRSPLLRNLKLMVKAGIPRDTSGEPWMQWSDHTSIPLATLQAAVVELLGTLRAERTSCRAVGLKNAALRRALEDIKGVIVGYPTNWPDTYSFNIRECVLSSGLVSSPDQVFFVEEAIAALLSALPAPGTLKDAADSQQPGLYNCNWSGGTVIISAGAILTETAVANLPADLDQLGYHHFAMRGYTYAGDAIDQDIICQLLHMPLPQSSQQSNQIESGEPSDSIGRWETLGLDEITLPQPGEADRVTRHRLRQRLNDSPLGREAILTARELKMALQEEEEVEVELGDHTWVITRKELETKVFLPYIQRINRQVNALLSKQNLATQTVKQVVCTGGSASLGAIARWLRQKFPNATIIQDTYSGEYSNSCSRVAYGLANLCHYPNVLDANRHQYNDYFLLLELLRILPEQPLPAGGILHLLEQRGINTQACQAHVLALIEGHLPPGLVPTSGDRPLISARAADIATYKSLSELPLFRKQGGQIYIADPKQGERLRSHLEDLLSTKVQSLGEPMSPAALMPTNIQA